MIICVWACVFFRVHVGQSTRSFVRVARVMCIVLSSPCCIHSLSHRSVYRWECNYVPQWSSLCFFTAQELSRQRSVCAPWKLPAENHMAMRAIMDFFSLPLRTLLSPSYSFSQCFSFCQWTFEQMSIDVCFQQQPPYLYCSSPINYLSCILQLFWKCSQTREHTRTQRKCCESVRKYANENNSKEMLH